MASLEELGDRIESARDVQSIVRVMKSLSAVSIRQYQEAAARLREYQEVVDLGLKAILDSGAVRWEALTPEGGGAGLIVMGSDRGLCGRFNETAVEAAQEAAGAVAAGGASPLVLAVGARAAARLEGAGLPPDTIYFQPGSAAGLAETAEMILVAVERWRAERGVVRVDLVFNRESQGGGLLPTRETLLPVAREEIEALARRDWPTRQLPMLEGEPEAVFSDLIRERLFIAVMHAGAESLSAEHATRLRAMQAAERNITDRLEDLAGEFRRTRQDEITLELMDIVAAYETAGGPGR